MKDKILPLEYEQYSVEELTEKANKIIESLEKENDLNNSIKKPNKRESTKNASGDAPRGCIFGQQSVFG